MKERYDKVDELKAKEKEEYVKKQQAQNSNFRRMMRMTEPTCIIAIGLIFSVLLGTVMPTFGVILTKLLFGLSAETHTLQ